MMVSTVDDVLKSSVRADIIVSISSEDANVDVTLCNHVAHTHLRKGLFGLVVDLSQTTPGKDLHEKVIMVI